MKIEGSVKDFSIMEDRIVVFTTRGIFVLRRPNRLDVLNKLLSEQRSVDKSNDKPS